MDSHLGEIAALSTAALWVVSSLSFTAAGREVGSSAVNLCRSLLAMVALSVLLLWRDGVLFPNFETRQLVLLGASGIVGLALGDQLLFTSFVAIGPRISMLVMTLAPVMGLGFAAGFLGEGMHGPHLVGMAITLAGVALVVTTRKETGLSHDRRAFGIGLLLALGATACQAGGMVLAKAAMSSTPDILGTQAARMLPALVALIAILGCARLAGVTLGSSRAKMWKPRLGKATTCIALGTVAGPVGGIMLALFAISRLNIGVATTFMALTPVLILPFSVWIEGERLTPRAIVGAIISFAGSAILALG